MHFSKTYQQLLLTLPEELRDGAIEYRRLKKLINQVVCELTSLGLSPDVLHDVLQSGADIPAPKTIRVNEKEFKVVYELGNASDHIEPRLRFLVESTDHADGSSFSIPINLTNAEAVRTSAAPLPDRTSESLERDASFSESVRDADVESVLELFTEGASKSVTISDIDRVDSDSETIGAQEVIIPLVSDTAFFQLLTEALQYLSGRLAAVRNDFEANLHTLSRSISHAARPSSSLTSFKPYSPHSTDPTQISVQGFSGVLSGNRSDLYAWREIFQLYVEAEIFESHREADRGERSIEDALQRLDAFFERLTQRGFTTGRAFKVKESREALHTFLQLNTLIMNLRKFEHATTEATRKILKKHAKRTSLPLAPTFSSPFLITDGRTASSTSTTLTPQASSSFRILIPKSKVSLSFLLGQALGENLLPIIPHIDDYACSICMSIAFKPIRLSCGHLFCVRCLVKMQKRGQDRCPMCRAPTVLAADRSNVDWALLNFMKDWFPVESRKKLHQNEKEVALEELEELGIEPGNCVIM